MKWMVMNTLQVLFSFFFGTSSPCQTKWYNTIFPCIEKAPYTPESAGKLYFPTIVLIVLEHLVLVKKAICIPAERTHRTSCNQSNW